MAFAPPPQPKEPQPKEYPGYHVLKGHEGWVWEVIFSQDGKYLVSASSDKTVKIWDMETLSCIKTLSNHKDAVSAIALSPDNKHLVSGSWDKSLNIYDFPSGNLLESIPDAHTHWILAVEFPGNLTDTSGAIISASSDQTIKIHNIIKNKKGKTKKPNVCRVHRDEVYSVRMDPTGKRFYSCAANATVVITRYPSGFKKKRFMGCPMQEVYNVLPSIDGDTLYCCGGDGILREFSTGGKLLHQFIGHESGIRDVARDSKGETLISCGHDSLIKFWDIKTKKCLKTIDTAPADVPLIQRKMKFKIFSVSINKDSSLLAIGTTDREHGLLKLYNLKKPFPAKSGSDTGDTAKSSVFPTETSTSTTAPSSGMDFSSLESSPLDTTPFEIESETPPETTEDLSVGTLIDF